MDSIILWLESNGTKATHDGTSIYIKTASGQVAEAVVGDFIVFDRSLGVLFLASEFSFSEAFEECTHDWEAIDDTDKDQCLFCEEVRTYPVQYFGDEVL
jgi:hypothetical protein